MKKILLALSILNFLYFIATVFIDNDTNLYMLPFGLPLLLSFVLLIAGIVSLYIKGKRKNPNNSRNMSIYIVSVNLISMLASAILFSMMLFNF